MKNRQEESNKKELIVHDRKELILCKIYTPNGNRLKINLGNKESITLDAIQLESLTWQERDRLLQLHVRNNPVAKENNIKEFWESYENIDPNGREKFVKITNEYAEVYINTVFIGGKECCEIVSPKIGYGKRLTPEELYSVAKCGHQIYNQFLQNPLGPEKKYEQ